MVEDCSHHLHPHHHHHHHHHQIHLHHLPCQIHHPIPMTAYRLGWGRIQRRCRDWELVAALLVMRLLGSGNMEHTTVEFQRGLGQAGFSCVTIGKVGIRKRFFIRVRFKMDVFILEAIICGWVKDALMDNMVSIFSENLEGHGITNVGCNTNPPPSLLLARWKGLIRIKVRDLRIELVLQESGDILQLSRSNFP